MALALHKAAHLRNLQSMALGKESLLLGMTSQISTNPRGTLAGAVSEWNAVGCLTVVQRRVCVDTGPLFSAGLSRKRNRVESWIYLAHI